MSALTVSSGASIVTVTVAVSSVVMNVSSLDSSVSLTIFSRYNSSGILTIP